MIVEKVKCPTCGKRLFDVEDSYIVSIYIKCPTCKNVIRFKVKDGIKAVRNIGKNSIPSKGVKRN